ncbi:MAG: glutamine--fructose-6-phosphate transaminase (isomerizing) [Clostridia bacterium]|nr:glutamine--fructose-6-phosphate transaminase (isomerizing) [Clostridia bacterium]
MCGIIGFTGNEKAIPKLVEGLAALEYRGYDSAGVAYFGGGILQTVKAKGRLTNLAARLENIAGEGITAGIGHTRWATHGEVSDVNSHPHGNQRTCGVHNGIIENYSELSAYLETEGYTFASDTDTERAILLIDFLYTRTGDPVRAMQEAAERIKGSFAFAVMFSERPDSIYAMRRDSPLLASPSDVGMFIASDISAVLGYTRRFARIEEGEVAVLTRDSIEYYTRDGKRLTKEYETTPWNPEAAERGGYAHFMIKEIHEEPTVVSGTVRPRIRDRLPYLDLPLLTAERIQSIRQIHIAACGTAMHAGLIGKYAVEKLARIPVNVEIASEFRYRNPILQPDDLVILISQSGETADTLAALRLAKSKGVPTLAVVNVPGSAIAREADAVLYTWAGPEIAVASTKAYSVQIALLYLLSIHFGKAMGTITEAETRNLCEELANAHQYIEKSLGLADHCRSIAEIYKNHRNIFFIGRGRDFALSMEAALKMKEISYIHCEAYAAGELKHGTISLIEKGTPVVAFATESAVFDKMISNIKEVRSRGARVLLFVPEGYAIPEDTADDIIRLPDIPEVFMPLCAAAPAQLLAYYTAVELGCDVDKPRNLAKSVTVE